MLKKSDKEGMKHSLHHRDSCKKICCKRLKILKKIAFGGKGPPCSTRNEPTNWPSARSSTGSDPHHHHQAWQTYHKWCLKYANFEISKEKNHA
jgi:hypothetical protein